MLNHEVYELILENNQIVFPIHIMEDKKWTLGAQYFLVQSNDEECSEVRYVEIRNSALAKSFEEELDSCYDLIAKGTVHLSHEGVWKLPEEVSKHLESDRICVEVYGKGVSLSSCEMYQKAKEKNEDFIQELQANLDELFSDDELLDKLLDDDNKLDQLLDIWV